MWGVHFVAVGLLVLSLGYYAHVKFHHDRPYVVDRVALEGEKLHEQPNVLDGERGP